MARLIYCYECATAADRFKPNREDVAAGWEMRRQWGRARCPEGHGLAIKEYSIGVAHADQLNTPGNAGFPRRRVSEALNCLRCDLCGGDIPDSSPALAVTEWNRNHVVEDPAEWESGFMDIVSEEEWHRVAARIGLVRKRLDEAEGKTDPRIPTY